MSIVHFPSRYRHCLPGGCSSSLVGDPSIALRSRSLVPVGSTTDLSVVSAAALGSAETAAAEASTGEAALPPRMLAAGAGAGGGDGGLGMLDELVLRTCCGGGVGSASRAMSSRAERSASHPDRNSNPTPTACVIRLAILIVIPKTPPPAVITAVWRVYGIMPHRARNDTEIVPVARSVRSLTTRRRTGGEPLRSAAPAYVASLSPHGTSIGWRCGRRPQIGH